MGGCEYRILAGGEDQGGRLVTISGRDGWTLIGRSSPHLAPCEGLADSKER